MLMSLYRIARSVASTLGICLAVMVSASLAQGITRPRAGSGQQLATPADDGKVVATLSRSDELVVIGKTTNGYVNVQGASASGWVKVVLVTKP
jgi:hypothetical protein